jgi:hypothetical protein
VGELNQSVFGSLIGTAGSFLSVAVQGAIGFLVVQYYQDDNVNMGECVRKIFTRLVQVIAVTILFGLMVSVPLGLVFVAVFLDRLPSVLVLLPIFGVILFIFLWLTYCLVFPACVAGNAGVIESFRVSRTLTKGNKLAIFGVHLVIALVYMVGFGILIQVFAAVYMPSGTSSALGLFNKDVLLALISQFAERGFGGNLLFLGIISAWQLVTEIIVNTLIGSMYLEVLLCQQEGNIGDMSAVFE